MQRAYYNEIDRFACDWLSNLMDANQITPGRIDDRSIVDVRPDDLAGYERVHFFAGIGGWDHALNLAGWTGPVWTGSCPCQPFSLAGKQKGFDDERHLWPVFRVLIAERRPPTIFGEQVASASAWLGLVRSDLEALEYAVGAMPFEAASAGADHLRDRYGFVADDGSRRRPGSGEGQIQQPRRAEAVGAGDLDMGDAGRSGLALGSIAEVERGNVWVERPPASATGVGGQSMADANGAAIWIEPGRRSGSHGAGSREYSYDREDGDVADSEVVADAREWLRAEQQRLGDADSQRRDGSSELSWVVGADGKARRVKPGICLLAHGVPNRVGLLRGFGNAIDPRPFAAFIQASAEAIGLTHRTPRN